LNEWLSAVLLGESGKSSKVRFQEVAISGGWKKKELGLESR
jgi:hypothetical protein